MILRIKGEYDLSVQLTSAAIDVLTQYSWPGNVRELANLVERLAVIKPNGTFDESDLPWPLRPAEEPQDEPCVVNSTLSAAMPMELPADGIDLKDHLSSVERDLITSALQNAEGVVQKAAELLGMRRTTLVEKIRRHGLRA